MNRTASVVWNGGLQTGNGKMTSQSQALSNLPYSFQTRFETKPGTNPEELLAAAHAACFSMVLAAELEKMGLTPKKIHTDATVSLNKDDDGWRIQQIRLSTFGEVPEASSDQFMQAAEQAKKGCPVSRLFRADVSLEAKLMNGESLGPARAA